MINLKEEFTCSDLQLSSTLPSQGIPDTLSSNAKPRRESCHEKPNNKPPKLSFENSFENTALLQEFELKFEETGPEMKKIKLESPQKAFTNSCSGISAELKIEESNATETNLKEEFSLNSAANSANTQTYDENFLRYTVNLALKQLFANAIPTQLTLREETEYHQFYTGFGTINLQLSHSNFKGSLSLQPSLAIQSVIGSLEESLTTSDLRKREAKPQSKIKCQHLKNFSKKFGDQFISYLKVMHKIDVKKKWRDKLSWKILNSYLEGQESLEGFDTRTFITLFLNFVRDIDIEKFEKSRVHHTMVRICYKIMTGYLKSACELIRRYDAIYNFNFVSIVKVWPQLEMSVRWEPPKFEN